MDIHEQGFQDFVAHQLPLGQLEYLWGLYIMSQTTNHTDIQPLNARPITEQEIEVFSRGKLWNLTNE